MTRAEAVSCMGICDDGIDATYAIVRIIYSMRIVAGIPAKSEIIGMTSAEIPARNVSPIANGMNGSTSTLAISAYGLRMPNE